MRQAPEPFLYRTAAATTRHDTHREKLTQGKYRDRMSGRGRTELLGGRAGPFDLLDRSRLELRQVARRFARGASLLAGAFGDVLRIELANNLHALSDELLQPAGFETADLEHRS